jgi:thioredoxin reductase (NADPH)
MFAPLEEMLTERVDENFQAMQRKVYCKVICDKRDELRVVGIHYLGPNAGEVMQGLAVAIKLGLKFKDL